MPAFGLEDNHFKIIPPAQIISEVSTITLATISLWSAEELRRIGWLDNEVVSLLYKLGSTGVWVARELNSGGTLPQDNLAVAHLVKSGSNPSYAAYPDYSDNTALNTGISRNLHRRITIIGITTDGAGAAAAAPMVTGPAGYYPVCRLKTIHSTVAEATTQLLFTATGGSVVGPARMDFNLAAYVTQEIAGAQGQLLFNLTDASSINIAVNSGPISATIQIEIEYWYET